MSTTMIDRDIESPAAWTRSTVSMDEGRLLLGRNAWPRSRRWWTALRANPLPVLALAPADFELAQCRRAMARLEAMLEGGPGFAIVDRLPLDRLGARRPPLLLAPAALIARPVAQKWDGTMVYDVRDLGRPPGNGVRPDITNAEQSFHTDNSYNLCPPEYVGLLCLHPAMEGGVSRIVSLVSAHNEMRRRHPDLLAAPLPAVLLRPAARACPGRRDGHRTTPSSSSTATGSPAGCRAFRSRTDRRWPARRSTTRVCRRSRRSTPS